MNSLCFVIYFTKRNQDGETAHFVGRWGGDPSRKYMQILRWDPLQLSVVESLVSSDFVTGRSSGPPDSDKYTMRSTAEESILQILGLNCNATVFLWNSTVSAPPLWMCCFKELLWSTWQWRSSVCHVHEKFSSSVCKFFFWSHYPPSLFKYSDCTFYRLLAKWFRSFFHVQIICGFSVKPTSYCQVENLNGHPLLCWIPEMMILLL